MQKAFAGPAPPVGASIDDAYVECDQGNWEQKLGDFEALEGADLESSVALARLRAARVGLQCVAMRIVISDSVKVRVKLKAFSEWVKR